MTIYTAERCICIHSLLFTLNVTAFYPCLNGDWFVQNDTNDTYNSIGFLCLTHFLSYIYLLNLKLKCIRLICMYAAIWLSRHDGSFKTVIWPKRHFIWIASPKSITNQLSWMKRCYEPWYQMMNVKKFMACYRYSVAFVWQRTQRF